MGKLSNFDMYNFSISHLKQLLDEGLLTPEEYSNTEEELRKIYNICTE